MNIKENLIAARKLIEKPENWCKHASFRDEKGRTCRPPRKAHSFCLMAAMDATNPFCNEIREKRNSLVRQCLKTNSTIFAFNDNSKTTHSDVLEVLDRAIAKAE